MRCSERRKPPAIAQEIWQMGHGTLTDAEGARTLLEERVLGGLLGDLGAVRRRGGLLGLGGSGLGLYKGSLRQRQPRFQCRERRASRSSKALLVWDQASLHSSSCHQVMRRLRPEGGSMLRDRRPPPSCMFESEVVTAHSQCARSNSCPGPRVFMRDHMLAQTHMHCARHPSIGSEEVSNRLRKPVVTSSSPIRPSIRVSARLSKFQHSEGVCFRARRVEFKAGA